MKIGNIVLKNPVISAPLAGISDKPFRIIAKRFGCSLVYSEMLSSMALSYENVKARTKASFTEEERPVNVQLLGRRADIMAKAARIVEEMGADIIDINAGCSVRKVLKNNEGAYLLKDFSVSREIIHSVVRSVKIPVTIKIRKVWGGSYEETLKFAKMSEEEGVQAITIHGRTPSQGFSGKADWEIIGLLKEKLSIPVIGNGDVRSFDDARRLKEITGCDGVMIGRASMGNPWIFSEVLSGFEGKKIPPGPDYREKIDFALSHYKMMKEYNGEKMAIKEMRKFFAWYIKGLKGSSRIREKIFSLEDYDQVILLMKEYKDSYENF